MGDLPPVLLRFIPWVWATAFAVTILALPFRADLIDQCLLMVYVVGFATLARGIRVTSGTALGPVFLWGSLALVLAIASTWLGQSESPQSGRPLAGTLIYLATLAALAALLTVLNARSPGSGAWAILMGLLVLVFLVPWLEGGGLARGTNGLGRLRLDNPWTIFYGLIVLAGVTNFLPTRHARGAIFAGLALILEYVALTHAGWSPETRSMMWRAVAWAWAVALMAAYFPAETRRTGQPALTHLWLWFRDRWGVVWGLRILERFNKSAESMGWNFRLGWDGPVAILAGEVPEIPDAAGKVLAGLLRRFADAETLDRVLAQGAPCEPTGQPGS